jgi:hypothetical protein
MKKNLFTYILLATLSIFAIDLNAQTIIDIKVKNPSNEKDRTMMLDILRANMYQEYKQELIFEVKHFKMSSGYAWFMGNAARKDGKQVKTGEYSDGTHVEALFTKKGDKWYLVESGAFSTDMWWSGISWKYPNAPKGIFDQVANIKPQD